MKPSVPSTVFNEHSALNQDYLIHSFKFKNQFHNASVSTLKIHKPALKNAWTIKYANTSLHDLDSGEGGEMFETARSLLDFFGFFAFVCQGLS